MIWTQDAALVDKDQEKSSQTTAAKAFVAGVSQTRPWNNATLINNKQIRPVIGNLSSTKLSETDNRNISKPVNHFNKIPTRPSKAAPPAQAKPEDSETLLSRLHETVQGALDGVTSQAKAIIRPAKKMFSDAEEFKKKWPPEVKLFYYRLRNPFLRGLHIFAIFKMSVVK